MGKRRLARAVLGGGFGRGGLRQYFLTGKAYHERHSPSKHDLQMPHLPPALLASFLLLQQSQEYAKSWRGIWQPADDKGVEAPLVLHMSTYMKGFMAGLL